METSALVTSHLHLGLGTSSAVSHSTSKLCLHGRTPDVHPAVWQAQTLGAGSVLISHLLTPNPQADEGSSAIFTFFFLIPPDPCIASCLVTGLQSGKGVRCTMAPPAAHSSGEKLDGSAWRVTSKHAEVRVQMWQGRGIQKVFWLCLCCDETLNKLSQLGGGKGLFGF